jgi:hypothetical protein
MEINGNKWEVIISLTTLLTDRFSRGSIFSLATAVLVRYFSDIERCRSSGTQNLVPFARTLCPT